MRILIAEDDARLRDVLARALRAGGYDVDAVARGDDALAMLLSSDYAAAVIDWRMPGGDGLEVIAEARRAGALTPILMLTARDTPGDRIAGLDAGSDDYLVKPFSFDELLARLRALMRRPRAALGTVMFCGALAVDPARRMASSNGKVIDVTPTEYAILELLARRASTVVSREAIANHAWPDATDPIGSNTIDVHIARLRAKLVGTGVQITAVRRAGYRLAS